MLFRFATTLLRTPRSDDTDNTMVLPQLDAMALLLRHTCEDAGVGGGSFAHNLSRTLPKHFTLNAQLNTSPHSFRFLSGLISGQHTGEENLLYALHSPYEHMTR